MSSGLRVLHSPRFAHFDLSDDRPSVKYSVAWSFEGGAPYCIVLLRSPPAPSETLASSQGAECQIGSHIAGFRQSRCAVLCNLWVCMCCYRHTPHSDIRCPSTHPREDTTPAASGRVCDGRDEDSGDSDMHKSRSVAFSWNGPSLATR